MTCIVDPSWLDSDWFVALAYFGVLSVFCGGYGFIGWWILLRRNPKTSLKQD